MFRTTLLMMTTCSWSRRPGVLLCPREWSMSSAKVFYFALGIVGGSALYWIVLR
jgi:hypothetical protein